jgi:hypothetical protein
VDAAVDMCGTVDMDHTAGCDLIPTGRLGMHHGRWISAGLLLIQLIGALQVVSYWCNEQWLVVCAGYGSAELGVCRVGVQIFKW